MNRVFLEFDTGKKLGLGSGFNFGFETNRPIVSFQVEDDVQIEWVEPVVNATGYVMDVTVNRPAV